MRSRTTSASSRSGGHFVPAGNSRTEQNGPVSPGVLCLPSEAGSRSRSPKKRFSQPSHTRHQTQVVKDLFSATTRPPPVRIERVHVAATPLTNRRVEFDQPFDFAPEVAADRLDVGGVGDHRPLARGQVGQHLPGNPRGICHLPPGDASPLLTLLF